MDEIKTLEIVYSCTTFTLNPSIKLLSFQFDEFSTVKDLKLFISKNYNIPYKTILLSNNKQDLVDDSSFLDKIFITRLSKIGNDSVKSLKVRVVPQVNLKEINLKFNFFPVHSNDEREENSFIMNYDLITNGSKLDNFKNYVIKFFESKLKELNYIFDENFIAEFYESPKKEVSIFDKNNDCIFEQFEKFDLNEKDYLKFYFLVRHSSIIFFRTKEDPIQNNFSTHTTNLNEDFSNLRISPLHGQNFLIILQSYNNSFKEIEVNSEMTVCDLKNIIESTLGIRKNYQELFYLVYKLTDENKKLKNYYMRPNGVLFLRGFFFPIVFTDFYEKSCTCILGINIAENVKCIKQEIIKKLNLQFNDFSLIFNGKELDDSRYLIDYNIQKMQTIYIK
jgi:hypothetical protein